MAGEIQIGAGEPDEILPGIPADLGVGALAALAALFSPPGSVQQQRLNQIGNGMLASAVHRMGLAFKK